MDTGHARTDAMLDELIKELNEHYSQAAAEVQKKVDKYFEKYKAEDAEKQAAVKAGTLSKADYKKWQQGKLFVGQRWKNMQDVLSKDLTHTNEIAADIINNKKCDVYALNHNYGTYEIEHQIGVSTSFVLYDHSTVERLIAEKPELLPKNKVDVPKDQQWNKKLIRNAVTQGVLQGESIPVIAKRMQNVTTMNHNSAVMNARTATTSAENAGRISSYERAEKYGIDMVNVWMSTLDARTRSSHRLLMGEKRKPGEKFSNGLRFPGDPNGPGWEVYNCRCTLAARINGYDQDLVDEFQNKVTKNNETFEQWQKGHSFPKHYNETVEQWMKRYADHMKKQSFDEWVKDQAMPDALIQSKWGNKKMSNIYNEIKAQNVTDANAFYKELGKLGKPSEIWQKYLTGQLDAEQMKSFESILKKYLPEEKQPKQTGVIHPNAQKSLDEIKFEKSDPMSFDDADMYHVNPNYTTNDGIYSVNCQTDSFAYECRRQGYDVEALGKDPAHSHTYALQEELGKDQADGWINRETGEKPKNLIDPSVHGTTSMYNQLFDAVGSNGERYIMGVKWKGNGAHSINVDRDENGNLRIIDNQRGKNEKHIWVGEKEIKKYLEPVDHLRSVYRVDDCVPNSKYLNMIVKESTHKVIPKDVTNFNNLGEKQNQVINIIGKKILSSKEKMTVTEYYDQYKQGKIKDADLDKLLGVKQSFDKSQLQKKSMSAVYTDIKSTDTKTANQLYKELQKQGKPADIWKKYLNGDLDPTQTKKIDDILSKKYSAAEAAMMGDSVTGLDIETLKKKKVTGVYNDFVADGDKTTANQFYKELKKIAEAKGYKSQGDVWKKYLSGELDFEDIEKIDKYTIKKYSKTTSPVDVSGKTKNDLPSDAFNLSADEFSKVSDKLTEWNTNHPGDKENIITYYKKYKNDEILDADLDKLFNIKSQVTVKPEPKPVKTAAKPKENLPEFISDLDDDLYDKVYNQWQQSGGKTKHATTYYEEWKSGEIEDPVLDEAFGIKKPEPKPTGFDKSQVSGKKMSQVFNDLKATSEANKFYKDLKSMGKPSEVWEEYLKGNLTDEQNKKIESHFGKTTAPETPQVDQKALANAKQKLADAQKELNDAKKNLPDNKTYSGIWKDDVTLEDYDKKKDAIAAKKQYFQDEINSYEIHIDDLEPWQMQKLASFYEHIQELDEFEKLGQEYSKAKNDLAPLEKKVKSAQDEVTKLSPIDEAYSQERKDAAVWAKDKTIDYRRVDKIFDAQARPIHATATPAEHRAYMEYTNASGGFNRPLAGFESPKFSGGSGWDEQYYKGVGKVPLDNEGKGRDIKHLTSFVAKSKLPNDTWVQTAQNFATLEGKNGFLGVPYGSLSTMTDDQLQQFVGTQNTLGQFISGSINKGGGSYTPGSMVINIYLPKGSEALYVLEDGTFGKNEHEIILQRGGTYRVSKIYWGTDAITGERKLFVDLELRLEAGYNKYKM